jgi:hypothetical protein
MLSGVIILATGCNGPEEVLGVRFKSFANTGSREIYLGVPDLGHGDQRTEKDFSWSTPGEHEITFILDRGDDKLVVHVDGTSLEYPNLTEKIGLFTSGDCTLDQINSFVISVVDRDTDAQVDFLDFTIDNSPERKDYIGDGTWRNYTFLNFGLKDGFRFDGTVSLDDGPFTGDEVSKIEIKAGCWLWP